MTEGLAMIRVFLAHAKSTTEAEIERLAGHLHRALAAYAQGRPFEIVTGRDYFEERFKECGSWDAWATEVATGVDYVTRRPLFDAIAVPSLRVGAGTARIVRAALDVDRLVLHFDEGSIQRIRRVSTVDSQDWKSGFLLMP